VGAADAKTTVLRSRERGTYSKESRPGSAGYRIVAADGLMLWAYDQAMLVCGSNGASRFWQDVVIDMSESQRAVEALRESEAAFIRFFPLSLTSCSSSTRMAPTSGSGPQMTPCSQRPGVNCSAGHTGRPSVRRSASVLAEVIGQVFETGRPQIWEYCLEVPAGLRWFQGRLAPLAGLQGSARRICLLVQDITEQKVGRAGDIEAPISRANY